MTERWAPIPGCEGFYEVSDQGRVRSLDRIDNGGRRLKGRLMRTDSRVGQRGYRAVRIYAPDGSRKMRYIHELILTAFVGPRPRGLYALHRDDDVDNNTLENLRWGTQVENMQDSMRNGTHPNLRITHCSRAHALEPWNLLNSKRRLCRSCHYARSYARHHGMPFDPEIADQRYVAARDGFPMGSV